MKTHSPSSYRALIHVLSDVLEIYNQLLALFFSQRLECNIQGPIYLQLAMLNLQCVNIEPSKVDQITDCLHLAGL